MQPSIPPAQPAPTRRAVLARVARVLLAETRLRAAERASVPGTEAAAHLPRDPGHLTPDWLTTVLCPGVSGARVTSTSLHSGTSSGTTARRAIEVTYNPAGARAGLPRHLFVKCTSSLAQRLMLGMGGLISGEPGFYTQVRPHLEIEAPAGYFGAVDSHSWRSVVVIEDVTATRGASFCAAAALSRAQIEELLAGVARWHAALWQHPALDSTWSWLRTPAEQAHLIGALIGMADRRPAGTRRAASVIPAQLQDRRDDLFEGMRRSLTWLGSRPHTYLHGDLHPGNTYLTADGRMGVCDWQVGMRGGWAHDVAYLLITALGVEERRAWERDLLEFYLGKLSAGGAPAPSTGAAWLSYRRATLYPYFAWLYTLGRSRLQPHFQDRGMALTLVSRIATAIVDLDSLAAVGL